MKGGDATQGFELAIDEARRVLKLRCWGFWTTATAEAYDVKMKACFERLTGRPWYVCADIREFPPQNEAVARVHGHLMAVATAKGMMKAVSIVHSSLTQMQIRRLATESRMPEFAFHTDEAAAMRWLVG